MTGGGAGPVEPIRDDELPRLFASLARRRQIVLAVSGGADSAALLLLAARWRDMTAADAPNLVAATVDHGLRPESAAEAKSVALVAQRLGVAHHTLVWSDPAQGPGLQQAARAARYRLLGALAGSLPARPTAIVTAHTADDQAETVVMRLKRGSGLDGLAGIPAVRPLAPGSEIDVVRPLLEIGRSRLVATLRAAGMGWIEDPSNANVDFERVRVRASLAALDEHGIAASALVRSAARLRRAREALEAMTEEFLRSAAETGSGVYARIDRLRFEAAPEDIRVRALARILGWFGGTGERPRLDQIEALVERLALPSFRGETLGGAMVRTRSRELVVFRETGRERFDELVLAPGTTAVWDGRFRVSLGEGAGTALVAGALGASGINELRGQLVLPDAMPVRAAEGIPAFRTAGGAILAVPQLGFVRQGGAAAAAVFLGGWSTGDGE